MIRAFIEALIPTPYRILGLRLRPFSLGHLMILRRFDCAYVTGEETTPGDLLLGLIVCSMTYEEAIDAIHCGRLVDEVERWGKVVSKRRWFGLRAAKPFDLMEKSRLFVEYLAAGNRCPKAFYDAKPTPPKNAPVEQILRVCLMRDLHLSESEIMNQPLALSWWDYMTLGELNDRLRLFDADQEKDLQAKADEFHARWMERNRQ